MLSTPFSLKPVPENTSQDLSSLIQNQPLLMKSEPEPTDNYSIQNNLSLVKKMPLTTLLEVIIPLEKKSSILPLTESENSLITVLVSKVSWSSMPSEEVLDLVLDLSYQKDYPSIMVKNPNSDSPSIHPHKSLLPQLNHITPFYLPTLSQNIPMSPLCQITKPSMISVEETQILKDQLIPT